MSIAGTRQNGLPEALESSSKSTPELNPNRTARPLRLAGERRDNRWTFNQPASDIDLQQLHADPLIARLLGIRDIASPDAARQFLKPSLNDLQDPAVIPGINDAADRIAQAIKDQQPIVIYGDYDVDGITASAILWHMLQACGAQVATYVPHRITEGYGLNNEALNDLATTPRNAPGSSTPRNASEEHKPLVITVDCGITAVEQAELARELGLDLIITDHHEFDPNNLPDAHTLVHPNLPNDTNPTDTEPSPLCGAGVAFKLAWQVAKVHTGSERLPDNFRKLIIDLLSFVALGTVADVVPLVGENRVLTVFGLGRIKQTQFVGLNALIDCAKLREDAIDAYHVGFVIGPRLNACGRMGHAAKAVHLLTDAQKAEAKTIAAFLTQENETRRATERKIVKEAKQQVVDAGYDEDDSRGIVVAGESWHQGVIGIVASRLVDTFHRPAVVLTIDPETGEAHGSARSVDGVDLHAALAQCSHHLTRFGGHAMAAGMGCPADVIDAFRDTFTEQVKAQLEAEHICKHYAIDAELTLADCTVERLKSLELLAPFGRCNPRPRFLIRNVELAANASTVGSTGAHLTLELIQFGTNMRAVAFRQGELAPDLPMGTRLDLVVEPKINTWRGISRPELQIQDLRYAQAGEA